MKRTQTPAKRGASPAGAVVKRRITAKTRKAVEIIATHGVSQTEAAKLVGMDRSALSRALNQPHVAEYLEQQTTRYIEDITKRKAIYRAQALEHAHHLLKNAKSEAVQARMVEFLAGEARGPAVQVTVNTGQSGYEYVPPNARVIEIEAEPAPDSPSGGDAMQSIDIVDD